MTLSTQLVLRALLAEPAREMYGLEICEAAGLPSGTIHPILARFENLGWLESRWEDIKPRDEGRPRRRYYRLTAGGTLLVAFLLLTGRRQAGRWLPASRAAWIRITVIGLLAAAGRRVTGSRAAGPTSTSRCT